MSQRRALVTGAARRVGASVALELSAAGYEVAVHYNRSAQEAQEVVDAIKREGGNAWCVSADLSLPDGVQKLVGTVCDRWDSFQLLVNNASLFEPKSFGEITDGDWERMLQVNLRAPFTLSRDLLPLLLKGGAASDPSLIVHMCDIGAERPLSGYAHYSVSKAGLLMLVKAMAVELGPQMRVVGVSPGHVAWPEGWSDDHKKTMANRVPLRRVGSPEDVARLIRFLAIEGTYISGDIVNVDGGLSCRY